MKAIFLHYDRKNTYRCGYIASPTRLIIPGLRIKVSAAVAVTEEKRKNINNKKPEPNVEKGDFIYFPIFFQTQSQFSSEFFARGPSFVATGLDFLYCGADEGTGPISTASDINLRLFFGAKRSISQISFIFSHLWTTFYCRDCSHFFPRRPPRSSSQSNNSRWFISREKKCSQSEEGRKRHACTIPLNYRRLYNRNTAHSHREKASRECFLWPAANSKFAHLTITFHQCANVANFNCRPNSNKHNNRTSPSIVDPNRRCR